MSVLLGDRKESKFEAITYSIELHDMLILLMQRGFGVKDVDFVNCEQLINELQRVVEIFDVDLNLYNRYVKAIDREIGLIKRWRQRDMAIKSRLEKG